MGSRYDKSEWKFKQKLREIEKKGLKIQRKQELKDLLNSYKKPKKKMQTTKLIALYLFFVLNIILVYSLVVMILFRDLSCLPVIITSIGGQIMTYLAYIYKAKAENTAGGITYEVAMAEQRRLDNESSDEAVG